MKPTINLIWITVSDLEKAVKYYSEVLGLELKELHQEFGWAELSGGKDSIRLGLSQANPQMPAGTNAVVTLAVEDIEASKKELSKKGVTLLGETMEVPGHVKLQMIVDQDGNQLQLVELLH